MADIITKLRINGRSYDIGGEDTQVVPIIRGGTGADNYQEALMNLRAAETTTDALTYYVNDGDGSDSNDGSESAPFKTIQHAVNAVPKMLNHTATIYVARGTYNESVEIRGFSGYNLILSTVEDTLETADNYTITGGVVISNSIYVSLRGFSIKGQATDTEASVYITANAAVNMARCKVDNTVERGILAGYGAFAYINNCYVANHTYAISTMALGNAHPYDVSGKDNRYGFYSQQGGAIRLASVVPSGFATDLYYQVSGGVITDHTGTPV